MPRDLFGSGTTPVALTRAFSRYTVVGSAALHLVIIAVVLIVPLFADDVLPRVDIRRMEFISPAFVQPAAAPTVVQVSHNAAPVVAPPRIMDEQPRPPENAVVGPPSLQIVDASGLEGALPNVGVGIGDGPVAPPAPPAPQVRPQVPQGPMRPGGAIREPVRTHYVLPVYPAIAQAARVEGTVVIEAIIGTDGTVQKERVVSGSPLLSDAAISAVRQWRYTPTTLNNQPVAVIMTVSVTFTLQH